MFFSDLEDARSPDPAAGSSPDFLRWTPFDVPVGTRRFLPCSAGLPDPSSSFSLTRGHQCRNRGITLHDEFSGLTGVYL